MHIQSMQRGCDVCATSYEQKLTGWKPGTSEGMFVPSRYQLCNAPKCHLIILCILYDAAQFGFKAQISFF